MSTFGVVVAYYGDEKWRTLANRAGNSAYNAGASEVVLMNGKNLAESRNTGALHLSTDYITFLDADDELHAMYFTALATYVEPDKKHLYKPQTLGAHPDGTYDKEPAFIRSGTSLYKSNSLVIGTTMRLSDFHETTGFDPELEALEDWDLFLRLHRDGAEIIECTGMIYIVSVGLGGRNSDKEKHNKAFRQIRRKYSFA